jgi:Ca-activated chloride channel family protein
MQTTIRVDHSLIAVESENRVHAMLEVTAPVSGGDGRPALNLALVIDRSGSMSGAKLEGAKQAARFLVDRLGINDTLALITFDGEVSLLAPSGVPDRTRLGAVINLIEPGGMTNLSGGWLKGIEELQRGVGGSQRRVLLLTDGHANVGVTDHDRLAAMAGGIGGEGIATSTIGFGERFDEDLLLAMAGAGSGNSYFAEGPDDAPSIFNEEFEGLATVASQNVSVEITPISDVEFVGVLHEYPTLDVPGGLQVQLGDFYGGENRRVIFEFSIPNVADIGQKHVADVVLRYTSVWDGVEMHEVTIPVHVNVVIAEDAVGADADRDVVDEVLIIKAAEDRKRAIELAEVRRHAEAAELLEERHRELEERWQASSRPDEMVTELAELRYMSDRMRKGRYSPADKKRLEYERWRAMRSKEKPQWQNPDDKDKW